ncbi:hypothetical protein NDU88_000979, partial [Pleurodeles waltl]
GGGTTDGENQLEEPRGDKKEAVIRRDREEGENESPGGEESHPLEGELLNTAASIEDFADPKEVSELWSGGLPRRKLKSCRWC